MKTFKNETFGREAAELVAKGLPLEKGNVGGASIETHTKEPLSFTSYNYKSRKDRDEDLNLALSLRKEPNEK